MNRDQLESIEKEIHFTGYARNKVKAMGNEIADITSKIEMLSGLVGEELLKDELYRNFVLRQRKEIKDIVAQIYSYLHLVDVEGNYDQVFKESK
ncbi:hypothetical protein GRF59_15050 [Paenibacillus sp. HJL G12]|uniref:Uncharacterized protein n=1 Tax=Paenibacillus dendrobii TaxID=2691084 RepID=A0A7X3IK12_9BACL|nr:hypothetical protein [Paenibacillus dendrobii]MWV44938.1 hypothetical protein [Paenibacillus dendrobii]